MGQAGKSLVRQNKSRSLGAAVAVAAIAVVLTPKMSVVYWPDFLFAVLAVMGCREARVRRIFLTPAIGLLVAALAAATLNQIELGVVKPFWQYHIIRVVCFFAGTYYLVSLRERLPMRFLTWATVAVVIATAFSVWEGLWGASYPEFIKAWRVEAFWADGGESTQPYAHENQTRVAGLYANWLEAGFVFALFAVVAFALAIGRGEEKDGCRWWAWFVVGACVVGIVLSGTRTAMVMAICGCGVVGALMAWRPVIVRGRVRARSVGVFVVAASSFGVLLLVASGVGASLGGEIGGRLDRMGAIVQTALGDPVSSVETTVGQYKVPSDGRVFLFGNGGKPWTPSGVESDVGYVQLWYGVGAIGLVGVIWWYARMGLGNAIRFELGNGAAASSLSVAILVMVFVGALKGNFFIGFRTGGDVVSAVLGALWAQRRFERSRAAGSRGT